MPVDVKAILARLQAATVNGWRRDPYDGAAIVTHDEPGVPRGYRACDTIADCMTSAAADLIAHAPEDLRALLAENAALRDERDSLLTIDNTTEVRALQSRLKATEHDWRTERERRIALPFQHEDGSECPTFYDGCNCSLEVLRDQIERAERAETLMGDAAQRLGAALGDTKDVRWRDLLRLATWASDILSGPLSGMVRAERENKALTEAVEAARAVIGRQTESLEALRAELDRYRERSRADALAVQLAESEAGAAAMRDGCKRLLDSLEEYVRQSMYLNPEWRDGIVAIQAALATDVGRKLLDGLRGLPQELRFTMQTQPDLDSWALAEWLHAHLATLGVTEGK